MTKISQLPADSSPTTTDVVPTVDVESNTTKKSTLANLITLFFNNIPNLKVTNASLKDGAGEPGGAWDSYTPTFANTTLGSGSVVGKYKQIGKTVHFRASFVLGSGSAVGTSPTVTLPITSVTLDTRQPIGRVVYNDSDTSLYDGTLSWTTSTTATLRASTTIGGAATYVRQDTITASTPFAFGSGDEIHVQGTYEAA